MKRLLLSGVALAALAVTPALAADLPRKAPVYMPPAPLAFSWTGFYVGGSAGIIGQTGHGTDFGDGTGDGLIGLAPSDYGFGRVGGLFGVDVGYNWQFAPNWVLGVEADIAGTTINGVSTLGVSSKLNSLGTIRGRIGYAFDRALIYATGGFAYGHVENRASYDNSTAYTVDLSGNRTGWTFGGGLEYAITNNWTARVEALYVDLGSQDTASPGNFSSCRFGFKNTYTVGRLGLNYKF